VGADDLLPTWRTFKMIIATSPSTASSVSAMMHLHAGHLADECNAMSSCYCQRWPGDAITTSSALTVVMTSSE